MTKEIIIDGVSINDCDLYCSRGYCMDDNISPIDCKDRPDCLYKQLIRLEQENKKLKKDVQLFKCLDTFGESECHCACRCLGNEFCEDADKKINSYRSALKKIKDLCIHYENTNDKCVINCYAHFIVTDLIQNKINEVLND